MNAEINLVTRRIVATGTEEELVDHAIFICAEGYKRVVYREPVPAIILDSLHVLKESPRIVGEARRMVVNVIDINREINNPNAS